MKCNNPRCESTELVYSGVDALCLGGIPTEEFCYSCAVGYVTIQNRIAELNSVAGQSKKANATVVLNRSKRYSECVIMCSLYF